MGRSIPDYLPPVTNRGWIQFSRNDQHPRLVPLGGMAPKPGISHWLWAASLAFGAARSLVLPASCCQAPVSGVLRLVLPEP